MADVKYAAAASNVAIRDIIFSSMDSKVEEMDYLDTLVEACA
jgi:tetrahydromethanopterin S-methyltransferase subunit B